VALLKHCAECPALSLTLVGEVAVLMAGLATPGCFFLWNRGHLPPLHGLADMEVFFWQPLLLVPLSAWRAMWLPPPRPLLLQKAALSSIAVAHSVTEHGDRHMTFLALPWLVANAVALSVVTQPPPPRHPCGGGLNNVSHVPLLGPHRALPAPTPCHLTLSPEPCPRMTACAG